VNPKRTAAPRAWIIPVVVLVAVVAGVWFVVFRESPEERATRLIREGRAAMEAQDFASAEARLQEALEIAPANPVLLHNLASVYVQQKRLPEARAAFEQAAASHGPRDSRLRAEELFQVASISVKEKNWNQAERELERAIAADPTRPLLHTRLLDLQLGALENQAAADSTTSRFLRVCGRTTQNLGDAAYLYFLHNSFAGAAELSRQAVALQDSFVDGHATLARSLGRLGRTREGLKTLEVPLARYPNGAPLWVAKSLLLLDVEKVDESLAAADRAVALAPNDFEAHQARQKALAVLGRYQEALAEIEIARELTQDEGLLRMLQAQHGILRRMASMGPGAKGLLARPDSSGTGS
jgi:tetratricopeptide (TPR) repeat protein